MNDAPDHTSQTSLSSRLFGWLFSWRTARRALIALAGLITVVAILWTEENWRGKRDWENYKRECEALGEKLDWQAFVPPPVSDEQNFFAAPIWAGALNRTWNLKTGELEIRDPRQVDPLRMPTDGPEPPPGAEWPRIGNWRKAEVTDLRSWQEYYRKAAAVTNQFPIPPQPQAPAADVRLALSKYDSAIEELRQASRRPEARLPIRYGVGADFDPAILFYLAELKGCFQTLQLRAIAELQLGDREKALADVTLMLRLSESVRGSPMLIAHLTRVAMLALALQPIWEGLEGRQFSDAQLAQLGQALAEEDLLADYQIVIRRERAFSNGTMDQYIAGRFPDSAGQFGWHLWLLPRGWLYQNELAMNRGFQQIALPAVDVSAHRVYPDKCETNAILSTLGRPSPYNIFARLLFPAVRTAVQKTALAQAAVDLATIACTLERYRLAHGEYPEMLDALVPEFAAKIPPDIMTGTPLKYRRTNPGQFVLYSVGWNGTDDGGVVSVKKSGSVDLEQGDWVWRWPN